MKLIKKILNWFKEYNKKSINVLKITRSIKTSFKCPKCKSDLYRINYSKSITNTYFCKNCNYEGPLGI